MFGNIGWTELLIILVIILLLFGARRLPELAKGMGESIRAFKKGMSEPQLEDKHQSAATTETDHTTQKIGVDH
jgi:sec-independent protein translocase protein TatA